MITEALIVRFFEGKCNAQEATNVEAWLKENPAKLKEYLGMEEWEEFQPADVLSTEVSGRLWNNIKKDATSIPVPNLYLRWAAVAASVVLIVGLSWQFISVSQKSKKTGVSTAAMAKNIVNKTAQKMMLKLSDGSTVELSPNSALSYTGNFNSQKREVVLEGEAEFNIARDPARPFFVYSRSVAISVLGTRFTVNADTTDKATKVILSEGKVMVKVADPSRDNKNEYYLAPGDIFISRKLNKQAPRILHLEKDKDDCYVFNNYPLDVVFDQLQIIYNTKIVYNKEELGNRTFIGKIDKKDSFDHILQSIALLNNFHLRKQGDASIISN
ncbi:MAG: FecR domain-containing protein [Bacteroidetes bacterium]|nr:FecR domain-containing protein [Bacteroidota bacterium]